MNLLCAKMAVPPDSYGRGAEGISQVRTHVKHYLVIIVFEYIADRIFMTNDDTSS